MNINPSLCKQLADTFGGNFYPDASLENIDGVTMAVYFNGSDFISLHPKDNACDYAYIRPVGSSVRQVDLGGCLPANYVSEEYRLVVVTRGPKSDNLLTLQRFMYAISPYYKVVVTSVLTDSAELYRAETGGGKKNIRIKGYNYYALNFKYETKISTCQPPVC